MTTESLVACFNDTIERSQTGELKEFTERAISSNFLYRENFSSPDCGRQNYADSAAEKILVVPDSTFAAARKNLQYGKTAVLNFANPQYPGGGASKGAVAQEECLCRCSNLYLCLSAPNIFEDYYFYHKKYTNHLFSDRLIYTKDVVVFKDESEVPALLPRDEWFFVDVITCAAPYIAKINIDNALLKSLFKSRIKNIFEAAIDNKVEVIILGAFGCGAFKNPPEVVAEAFHEVIDENGYADNFKKIVFAIKCNPNNTKNLDVFQEEFSKDEEKSACVELPWLNDLRERVENNYDEFADQISELERMCKYYKSSTDNEYRKSSMDDKYRTALLSRIADLLAAIPMYFPIEVDVESFLNGTDPSQLKLGDVITPSEAPKYHIKMLEPIVEDGVLKKIVPMFTTKEHLNNFYSDGTSCIRIYPCDYLRDVVLSSDYFFINPGDDGFAFTTMFLNDIVMPRALAAEDEATDDNDEIGEGTIIENKYKIVKHIARGGAFDTYLAIDIRLNLTWAVKVSRSNRTDDMELIKNQINILKQLDHPMIPRFADAYMTNGKAIIVQEYVAGETLEDIVNEYGGQSVEHVVDWIGQICNVMGYLHMQSPMFIYRDVKPANFILEPSGRIRVVDFDIIRAYKPGRAEDTANLGTKGYAAPEQFGGRGQTDPRTDVYGIGVTMYRLLTGADVQERNIILNPITLDEPGIPSGLAYIINKCTQFNPRERYNSCDELLNDLVRYNELPPKRGLFSRLKIR